MTPNWNRGFQSDPCLNLSTSSCFPAAVVSPLLEVVTIVQQGHTRLAQDRGTQVAPVAQPILTRQLKAMPSPTEHATPASRAPTEAPAPLAPLASTKTRPGQPTALPVLQGSIALLARRQRPILAKTEPPASALQHWAPTLTARCTPSPGEPNNSSVIHFVSSEEKPWSVRFRPWVTDSQMNQ
jgi:hypothetical protein